MMNYREKAFEDAVDAVENFEDEIVDLLIEKSECFDNIYDYSDSYHHESHIDKSYTLQEAAELLEDLSEFEETDYGLWEGCDPRRAIGVMAAFTYGNAVSHVFSEYAEDINRDYYEDDIDELVIAELGEDPDDDEFSKVKRELVCEYVEEKIREFRESL